MMSFYVSYYRGGYFSDDDIALFVQAGMMTKSDYDLALTYKAEHDANYEAFAKQAQADQYPSK